MEPKQVGGGEYLHFINFLVNLPMALSGQLCLLLSILVCQPRGKDAKCQSFASLERFEDKNMLSEFLPRESKAILKASNDN